MIPILSDFYSTINDCNNFTNTIRIACQIVCFIQQCFEFRSPTEYKLIKFGDAESLKSINFDSKKPTKFLIHGFKNNATGEKGYFPRETKNGKCVL